MKKIITAILALMLTASVAYAENTATVNYENATINIDFECDGASFALIMIKNRDTGKYIYAGQKAVNEGKLAFAVPFDKNVDGGDYDVIVTTDNKKTYPTSFYYLTEGAKLSLLSDINFLVDSSLEGRVKNLRDIIEEKDFIFNFDIEKYTYLSDKDAVASEMLTQRYATIDDFSERLDEVIEELYKLQKDDEAAKKLSTADVDDITGILEEYDDVFGITLDDTYYKYQKSVNAQVKASNVNKADEVYEIFQKAMAIPYVNEADRLNILSVIEAYDEYLDIYDTLMALTGDEQVAALKALESGTFKSVSDIEKAISKAKQDLKDNVADYSDEESSSTYKVSQAILDRRVDLVQDMVTEDDFNQDKIFTDLGNAAWAEEAVLALYDMGVVSGKGEKKFSPNDKISRAELVTMLVKAYELSKETEEEFNDVKNGDWYYNQVMTARAEGIASGDEYNNFNPNASVTRQDMAVLIYRAMGSPEAPEAELFTDDADISDYAKAAVYYMKESKMISGMEDGSFAPSASATRAQCALMIYNALAAGTEE